MTDFNKKRDAIKTETTLKGFNILGVPVGPAEHSTSSASEAEQGAPEITEDGHAADSNNTIDANKFSNNIGKFTKGF